MLGILIGLFFLVSIILTPFAWGAIIVKAGYSRTWILVPLTPIATMVLSWIYLQTGASRTFGNETSLQGLLNTLGIMMILNLLAFTFAWIMFLIFAFRPWPNQKNMLYAASPCPSPVMYGASRPVAAPNVGATTSVSTALPPSARGPVDARRRIYCPWCAESIPGNRALGHDCGLKDRPEVFCRYCGKTFPEGTNLCPACDALSTTES
jgi:hypothetical protein